MFVCIFSMKKTKFARKGVSFLPHRLLQATILTTFMKAWIWYITCFLFFLYRNELTDRTFSLSRCLLPISQYLHIILYRSLGLSENDIGILIFKALSCFFNIFFLFYHLLFIGCCSFNLSFISIHDDNKSEQYNEYKKWINLCGRNAYEKNKIHIHTQIYRNRYNSRLFIINTKNSIYAAYRTLWSDDMTPLFVKILMRAIVYACLGITEQNVCSSSSCFWTYHNMIWQIKCVDLEL